MYAARRWSVRHARGLRSVYQTLARLAPWLAPLVRLLGRAGAEAVARPAERAIKGFLFDCRKIGRTHLSTPLTPPNPPLFPTAPPSLPPGPAPWVRLLGRAGAEAVARPVERAIKGFLFDCR